MRTQRKRRANVHICKSEFNRIQYTNAEFGKVNILPRFLDVACGRSRACAQCSFLSHHQGRPPFPYCACARRENRVRPAQVDLLLLLLRSFLPERAACDRTIRKHHVGLTGMSFVTVRDPWDYLKGTYFPSPGRKFVADVLARYTRAYYHRLACVCLVRVRFRSRR